MNLLPLFQTLTLCLAFILFESVGATKKGRVWFDGLKRPKYSPAIAAWYFISGLHYIICGIVGYRLFLSSGKSSFVFSFFLLVVMMIIYGLSNIFLFRLRSLSLSLFAIFLVAILTAILCLRLLYFDRISFFILSPYLIWSFYNIFYCYCLRKLNSKNEKKKIRTVNIL